MVGRRAVRIGVRGAVGAGKTTLVIGLAARLVAAGHAPVVLTNDLVTRVDEEVTRRALAGILDPERIVGVETDGCPHAAVDAEPGANLEAAAALEARFPDTDVLLIESDGDNPTLTFSPLLAEYVIGLIDVAAGPAVARKQGPFLARDDLLLVTKVDLAPLVGVDLHALARDTLRLRGDRPTLFVSLREAAALDAVFEHLQGAILPTPGESEWQGRWAAGWTAAVTGSAPVRATRLAAWEPAHPLDAATRARWLLAAERIAAGIVTLAHLAVFVDGERPRVGFSCRGNEALAARYVAAIEREGIAARQAAARPGRPADEVVLPCRPDADDDEIIHTVLATVKAARALEFGLLPTGTEAAPGDAIR